MTEPRTPAVAGQFYAGTKTALTDQIESAYQHPVGPGTLPTVDLEGDLPMSLVSPHAGYPYSGPVAAHGFARLAAGGRPNGVIIVGPNHGRHGVPLAISGADAWETPLGTVPIHDSLRTELANFPGLDIDESTHEGEHSLEVQVPFIQYLYEDEVPILPILMSRQDETRIDQLVDALDEVLRKSTELVLIASTDLTHYEPQNTARRADRAIREGIVNLDDGAVMGASRSGHTMCGPGPTGAILRASRDQGAEDGTVLKYATSGDTAGGSDSVVGYVSAAIE